MKKYLLAIGILLLLSACNNQNIEKEPFKDLYSTNNNKFSVLAIEQNIDPIELEQEENINKIEKVYYFKTLEDAKGQYPSLDNEASAPLFIAFSKSKQVLKTNDYQELINFLKK